MMSRNNFTMRYISLFTVALAAVVVVLFSPTQTPTPAAAQDGQQQIPYLDVRPDCKLSGDYIFLLPDTETVGESVVCGQLLTYEEPGNLNSNIIANPFMILKATGDTPVADPILYFSGGPGSSALLGAVEWVESPLREDRDIVLMEQRGAGFSYPSLNCDVYASTSDRDCIRQIEATGANLSNYTTTTNAADIVVLMEELSAAFNYPAFNVYGISYGTRLGLEVMRQANGLLRSVVLDSAYPPDAAWMEMPLNAQRAFDTLFAYCAADAACNTAYPDLEDVFYEVVATLNDDPRFGHYDGADFIDDLYFAMYNTEFLPGLPAAITLYSAGDYREADELMYHGPPQAQLASIAFERFFDAYDDDALDGFYDSLRTLQLSGDVYNIFMCNEVYAVEDIQTAFDLAERADINDAMFNSQINDLENGFDRCDTWNFDATAQLGGPVFSDVPTLVLAGDFDPITPPRWGKLAAEALDNSYFYTFPGVGHAVIDGGACPVDVVLQFLATPDTQPDASCRSEMVLEFYFPD
jgi:pimeloyl-ACP methyl ester carboxylesterase